MISKLEIHCWAMRRRTSENSIHNSIIVPSRGNNLPGKYHLLRSSFTFLREKEYRRVKHNGLTNYSASSSSISVEDHHSNLGDSIHHAGVLCQEAKNCLSNSAHIKNKKIELLKEQMAEDQVKVKVIKPQAKEINCSACNRCVEQEIQFKGPLIAANVPSERQISPNYKSQMAMNEQYMNYGPTQPSIPSIIGRDERRQDCRTVPPNSFMGIMNNLASTVIRVMYHIFLIIAQVVPVFEVFPCVYDFVDKSLLEIRGAGDRKEVLTKSALLILQVLVILISFIFVLCAVLVPVFTLCTVVLRRLFFFI